MKKQWNFETRRLSKFGKCEAAIEFEKLQTIGFILNVNSLKPDAWLLKNKGLRLIHKPGMGHPIILFSEIAAHVE